MSIHFQKINSTTYFPIDHSLFDPHNNSSTMTSNTLESCDPKAYQHVNNNNVNAINNNNNNYFLPNGNNSQQQQFNAPAQDSSKNPLLQILNQFDASSFVVAQHNTILQLQESLNRAQNEIASLNEKILQLETSKPNQSRPSQTRYWTEIEHQKFLEALEKYGAKDVKSISAYVGTRSPTQVRTHAQKYFIRLDRQKKKEHDKDAAYESSANGVESKKRKSVPKRKSNPNPIKKEFSHNVVDFAHLQQQQEVQKVSTFIPRVVDSVVFSDHHGSMPVAHQQNSNLISLAPVGTPPTTPLDDIPIGSPTSYSLDSSESDSFDTVFTSNLV